MQFRLWMVMVTVAVSAGIMAELGQRRERLARIGAAHRERAAACFRRIPSLCKWGQTPRSIEAFYRREGPTVWLDYQMARYHGALAYPYENAADRTWLPLLLDLPPLDGLRNVRTLAQWGMEAALEATPFLGIFVLRLTLRAGAAKAVGVSFEHRKMKPLSKKRWCTSREAERGW